MILGIFIIQAAIQTAVQITPAVGANLLPSNLALHLDGLPARVTKHYFLLYTQTKKKLGFISSEFRVKNSFPFSELLTPNFLGRFPAGSFGSVLQEDPPIAGPGADLVRQSPILGLASCLPFSDELYYFLFAETLGL